MDDAAFACVQMEQVRQSLSRVTKLTVRIVFEQQGIVLAQQFVELDPAFQGQRCALWVLKVWDGVDQLGPLRQEWFQLVNPHSGGIRLNGQEPYAERAPG